MSTQVGPAASADHPSASTAAISSEAGDGFLNEVMAEIHGGGDGGGEPASEPDEGSSPESVEAAPDTPDGDVESQEAASPDAERQEGDDYTEEEAAEALAAQDSAAEQIDPSHAKTWQQYKTPKERAKALFETKRYAAEMSRRNKELEAQIAERTAAPEPTAEAPTLASPTDVESTLQSLMQSDQTVASFVEETRAVGARTQAALNERNTTDESIRKSREDILGKQAVVAHLDALVKANPEDFRAKEALSDQRGQLLDLKANHQELLEKRRDAHDRFNAGMAEYRDRRNRVYSHAQASLNDRLQATRNEEIRTRERKNAEISWKTSFPRAMKALGIPKEKQARTEQFLLREAFVYRDINGKDIGNLEAWMLTQGKEIADFLGTARAEAATDYKKAKKADAAILQPGPRGDRAVAKGAGVPKKEERLSSREASRAASSGFDADMRRGAR